jgi:hypothetical protein
MKTLLDKGLEERIELVKKNLLAEEALKPSEPEVSPGDTMTESANFDEEDIEDIAIAFSDRLEDFFDTTQDLYYFIMHECDRFENEGYIQDFIDKQCIIDREYSGKSGDYSIFSKDPRAIEGYIEILDETFDEEIGPNLVPAVRSRLLEILYEWHDLELMILRKSLAKEGMEMCGQLGDAEGFKLWRKLAKHLEDEGLPF